MNNKSRPYTKAVENGMKLFHKSLNEKDRRHYVAIEAHKLGNGFVSYISEILNCSRQTIYSGLDELSKKDFLEIRREGGGRKDTLKKTLK